MAPYPRRRTSRSPPILNVSGSATELRRHVDVHLQAALGGGDVDPFDHCVRAVARRPEQDRGDARVGEQRRVGPERDADHLAVSCVPAHDLRDALAPVDLEWGPREHDPARSLDVAEQAGDLAFDLLNGLTGNRAALRLE